MEPNAESAGWGAEATPTMIGPPTWRVEVTWLNVGSILERARPTLTQTPLLSAASPVGAAATEIVRTALRDGTSTRVTLLSSRLATHSVPRPDVSATGRAPTGTVATTEPDGFRATTEFAATALCGDPPS